MLTPRMALRLETKGSYLRTMTKIEIRRNVLNITELDRSLLGGVDVVDQSTRLKINYLESFKVGKWIRDFLNAELPVYWDRHLVVSKFSADLGLENKRHLPQHQFIGGALVPSVDTQSLLLLVIMDIPWHRLSNSGGLRRCRSGLGKVSSTLIPFFDWAETFVTNHCLMNPTAGLPVLD